MRETLGKMKTSEKEIHDNDVTKLSSQRLRKRTAFFNIWSSSIVLPLPTPPPPELQQLQYMQQTAIFFLLFLYMKAQ